MTNAVTAHGEAKQATEAAEQHTEQLRAAAERAAGPADEAQRVVTSVTEQTATLAAIAGPHDLNELTAALTALRARHAELAAETDAAEDAYRAAQTALKSAPLEATLSNGQRTATALHDNLTADLTEWDDRDQALSVLAAAAAAATDANDALAAARATLDAARLADEAGTLRARLLAGQPCPVCEQPVQAVPAGHDTSHFAAAEKELASAQSRYDRATKEHARLDRIHRDTIAARTGTLRHVETARTELRTSLRNLQHRWRRTRHWHGRRGGRSCAVTEGDPAHHQARRARPDDIARHVEHPDHA